jgi:hypothetical protein
MLDNLFCDLASTERCAFGVAVSVGAFPALAVPSPSSSSPSSLVVESRRAMGGSKTLSRDGADVERELDLLYHSCGTASWKRRVPEIAPSGAVDVPRIGDSAPERLRRCVTVLEVSQMDDSMDTKTNFLSH